MIMLKEFLPIDDDTVQVNKKYYERMIDLIGEYGELAIKAEQLIAKKRQGKFIRDDSMFNLVADLAKMVKKNV